MKQITVVSLGPGSPDLLTLGALKTLQAADRVLLRTNRHGVVSLLQEEGIAFSSLDHLHEGCEDFDNFIQAAVREVMAQAASHDLVYAVADATGDETVRALKDAAGDALRLLPGLPLAAPMLGAALPRFPVMLSCAVDLQVTNAQQPLCVVELDSAILAGEVKLKLLERYGEDARVAFFPPTEEEVRSIVEIPLTELDRQPRYDHTCGFVVFPQSLTVRSRFDPEDLLAIMRRLRSPEGCPWDREQTHQSLAKYLVEEANEAACALLEADWDGAAEELGDVFLQLAFHAVVGEERGTFTWADMLQAICEKLIRRHPHVFGENKLDSPQAVLAQWDEIKQQEKNQREPGLRMLDVPRGMAPLMRAEKVQQLAAKAGFDWDHVLDALPKVHEEAEELKKALISGEGAVEELGDLFFSCINVARLIDVSADQAIHFTTEKFIRRYIWMEKAIKNDGKDWNLLTINEIGVYWERSKAEC